MSQSWPRSMSPYDISTPKRIKFDTWQHAAKLLKISSIGTLEMCDTRMLTFKTKSMSLVYIDRRRVTWNQILKKSAVVFFGWELQMHFNSNLSISLFQFFMCIVYVFNSVHMWLWACNYEVSIGTKSLYQCFGIQTVWMYCFKHTFVYISELN